MDPATLTENDRKELNVSQMLPANVGEALQALREDDVLTDMLTEELVERYAVIKEFEVKFLTESFTPEQQRNWILDRY